MKTSAGLLRLTLAFLATASVGFSQEATQSNPVFQLTSDTACVGTTSTGCVSSQAGNCTATAPLSSSCGSPFDGPFGERPLLLGSVFVLRDSLAENGITVNASAYQYYQGVASGGVQDLFRNSGRNDYFVNVDGEKAGLWKGFFINLHGETRYGDTVNAATGSIMPVNVAEVFPTVNGTTTALTGVKFTQALSENFITFAGKLNLLDTFNMPFTGARAIDGFWNLAITLPVVVARTAPYSTLGAGAAVLQDGAPIFSLMVLDTNNTPTTSGFQSFFNNGATIIANAILPTRFMGLPGQQGVLGTYSSGKYNDLAPTPYYNPNYGFGLIPGFVQNSWSVTYMANQAFWVDPCNPKRVFGGFTNIGFADNGPSPISFSANAALYGSSPLANRTCDTFGVGYAYTQYSSPVKNFAPLLLPIGNDQVVELFYNYAVTRWFSVTPDFQVVIPAREATLPPGAKSIDTAVVVGVRAKVDF